jgi:hypothetical protein
MVLYTGEGKESSADIYRNTACNYLIQNICKDTNRLADNQISFSMQI